MFGLSPQTTRAAWVLMCMSLCACGRFGFDVVRSDIERDGHAARDEAGVEAGSADNADAAQGTGPADGAVQNASDAASSATTDSALPVPGRDGGSATPDGGTAQVDAGPEPQPDAGPICGASFDCACIVSSLACTDFTTLPSTMNLAASNGTATSASGFLRAVTNGGTDAFAKVETSLPTRSTGTLYMRFRVRVKSGSAITALNIATLGRLAAPDFGVDFNLIAGEQLEIFTSGDGAVQRAAYTVPRDTWLCFEAKIGLGNGSGTALVRIDGQSLLNRSGLDTVPPGGVVYSAVGIDFASSAQAQSQVDVDDFVIATAPLGTCP